MLVMNVIAEILKREGVSTLFCFPTTPIIEAAAAVGIKPVICRQERVGVHMADGFSRVSNGRPPGVFAMQYGPGAENAFAGVATAFSDSSPVVFLPLGHPRETAQLFPMFKSSRTYASITKSVEEVILPDEIGNVMRRAFSQAKNGRPGPVMVEVPADVHSSEVNVDPSKYQPVRATRSAGDPRDIDEAAGMLLAASCPMILAGQGVFYAEATGELRQLAELLQAPVIDNRSRMNMPNTHYLCQSERATNLLAQADCILSLEPVDLFGQLHAMRDQLERTEISRTGKSVKVISISTRDLLVHSNYQDFQRYVGADLSITADAQTTLPFLIEAVQQETGSGRRNSIAMRGEKLRDAYSGLAELARAEAALAWDASPISTARMYMELWELIRNEDWALVSDGDFSSRWPHRLWPLEKHYRFIGGPGGYGVGYQSVAALGAALAHRDAGGRVVISITGDGEFNMAPHTPWTAAHHGIPYLTIIQNNRAYHQEVMHVQRMANRHNRGVRNAHIGTTIDNPNVDYVKIAQGYGAVGIGPITDPNDLSQAFRRGIAAVKAGQPALIDVVTQPR